MSTATLDNQEFDEDAAFDAAVGELEGKLPVTIEENETKPLIENEDSQTLDLTNQEVVIAEGQDDSPSWMDSLPDDAKKHFSQLESENQRLTHSVSSQIGRTRAATEQLTKVKDQLDSIKSQDLDMETMLSDEFAEDYPDVAEVLKKSLGTSFGKIQQSVDSIADPLKSMVDNQLEDNQVALKEQETFELEQNKSTLKSLVPDVENIIKNDAFWSWVDTQPDGVRRMAKDSDSIEDAAFVLQQYKSQSAAQAIKKRRSTQLSALSGPSSTRGGGRSADLSSDDEDALFNEAVRQMES